MAGITDAAMRTVSFRMGANVCYTEMVSSMGLTRGSSGTRQLMERLPQEGPLIVQLYGGDAESMGRAAGMAAEHGGFVGIDVNAGCPVPKVLKSGGGAALMRDPRLIGRIVAAMVAETRLPVTVKTRIGLHPGAVTVFDVIKAVEDAGGAGLAVHGRFASAGHGGAVDLELLAKAVECTKLPVVVNGGVNCAADAVAMIKATGAAGVMVGRGAVGNPWLFGEIVRAFDGEAAMPTRVHPAQEVLAMLKDHLTLLVEFHQRVIAEHPDPSPAAQDPESLAVRSFRLYLFNYFKGLSGAVSLRREMASCSTIADIMSAIQLYSLP